MDLRSFAIDPRLRVVLVGLRSFALDRRLLHVVDLRSFALHRSLLGLQVDIGNVWFRPAVSYLWDIELLH